MISKVVDFGGDLIGVGGVGGTHLSEEFIIKSGGRNLPTNYLGGTFRQAVLLPTCVGGWASPFV